MAGGRARFGLIGYGSWGKVWAKVLTGHPSTELAGVASGAPADDFLRTHKIPMMSEAELLASGLAGVVIAGKPENRAASAEAAARAGVPAILEKPIAFSVAEAERIKACEAAPYFLYVNHNMLFSPAYRALKAGADPEGIQSIELELGNQGPVREYSPLWDYGPHGLAAAYDLMGNFYSRVFEWKREDGNGGSSFEIRLRLSGADTLIRVGNNFPVKVRRLKVRTPVAEWQLDDLAPAPLTRNGAVVSVEKKLPMDALLDEFLGLGGGSEYSGTAMACAVTETIARILAKA